MRGGVMAEIAQPRCYPQEDGVVLGPVHRVSSSNLLSQTLDH